MSILALLGSVCALTTATGAGAQIRPVQVSSSSRFPTVGPVTLSGVLGDSLGNRLSGATVSLYPPESNCYDGDSGAVASGTTASDGSFSVPVSPGSYDVWVTYPGESTNPGFGICTENVDLASPVNDTLTVPVTQLTVTAEDSNGDLLQGATIPPPTEIGYLAEFDLFPGQAISDNGYVIDEQTFTTSAKGTAIIPLMPITRALALNVDPPPGSGLAATDISTGLMTANTAVTATLAGSLHHPTRTTLSSAPNPSAYHQAVTFTATVTPTDGQGTVSFATTTGKYKALLCPHQSLRQVAGTYQATCTTSSLGPGTHTVVAVYSGDTSYSGSSAMLNQTVTRIPTATTLASSNNPSTYGQAVTFTAAVSPTDGAGSVTFQQAGQTIPGCAREPLRHGAGSYQATCTTSALPGGTDTITAAYTGDQDYARSTATLSQVVNPAPTTTTLTSSRNPTAYGQIATFTATISVTHSGGTVTFSVNGNPIPTCTNQLLTLVSGHYTARCQTTALPIGTNTVKAAYSGDPAYQGSSTTLTQQVKPSAQANRPHPGSNPIRGRPN